MQQKINGSLDVLNSLQISADVEGMDTASKDILKNKEVLAVILQGLVREYGGYTPQEVMGFIEADTITSVDDVTTGRTNTRIRGEGTEFTQLNEKTSNFDIRFKSRNPLLSTDVQVNLHVDIEPQKDYRPGYPIEKRGLYYLARSLASQLSVVTGETDYSVLEKCYSIWICRDNIPRKERYSISYYDIQNSKNLGGCQPEERDYDLLSMVIVRLGHAECPEGEGVLEFLNAIFYPHREDFLETVQKYIDFSQNKELMEEVAQMSGLGMSILEEGIEKGIEKGKAQQLILSVESLGKTLGLPLENACHMLGLDVGDYHKAVEILKAATSDKPLTKPGN